LKKNGPNYSALHKLIIPLNTNSMEDSLLNIIENSGLSKESKDYFKKLVEFSEKKSYGNQRINERFEYKENLFKELLGILKLK
jgi:single-stranded DNA-specific DHH superfamily exonuclease